MKIVSETINEDESVTLEVEMSDDLSEFATSLGLRLLIYCGATETTTDEVFDFILRKGIK